MALSVSGVGWPGLLFNCYFFQTISNNLWSLATLKLPPIRMPACWSSSKFWYFPILNQTRCKISWWLTNCLSKCWWIISFYCKIKIPSITSLIPRSIQNSDVVSLVWVEKWQHRRQSEILILKCYRTVFWAWFNIQSDSNNIFLSYKAVQSDTAMYIFCLLEFWPKIS